MRRIICVLTTLSACSCLLLASFTSSNAATSASITLSWTAPGDDGMTGRASVYDVRYALAPITSSTFSSATRVTGVPAPQLPGVTETLVVGGLTPGMTYYFAIKTGDEIPNWAPISNVIVAPATTTAMGPQLQVASLSSPWPNPARDEARWTYALPAEARLEIDVFDLAGRRVRHVADGLHAAGQGEVAWNLRDDDGHRVAAGVYLARATLGTRTTIKRIVVTP